jgi:hypothetical protein
MTDFEDMLLKMLLKIQRQAPCVWKADDSVEGLFYRVTQALEEDALVDAEVTPRQIAVSGLTSKGKSSLTDLHYQCLRMHAMRERSPETSPETSQETPQETHQETPQRRSRGTSRKTSWGKARETARETGRSPSAPRRPVTS